MSSGLGNGQLVSASQAEWSATQESRSDESNSAN